MPEAVPGVPIPPPIPVPVVGLERFFLTNAAMDALLLTMALMWLDVPVRKGRLALGAGFGGVYGCLAFLDGFTWLGWLPLRFLAAAGLLRAAAGPLPARHIAKGAGFMAAAAFLTGGAAQMLSDAFPSGGLGRLAWILPLGGAAALLCALAFRKRQKRAAMTAGTLHIRFREKQLALRAQVDTGNHAVDPSSGLPVAIVPYETAVRAFPALREGLPQGMRLVPMSTVAGRTLLPGFTPSAAVWDGYPVRVCVAVAPKGTLRAALAPSVFAAACTKDKAKEDGGASVAPMRPPDGRWEQPFGKPGEMGE